jgi:hypothetical protein
MHKPSAQHLQQKHRITVVSEGLLFVGRRTPSAFVWEEAGAAPDRPAKAPALLSDTVLALLVGAGLSREDRSRCRRQVGMMPGRDLHWLAGQLRKLRARQAPR